MSWWCLLALVVLQSALCKPHLPLLPLPGHSNSVKELITEAIWELEVKFTFPPIPVPSCLPKPYTISSPFHYQKASMLIEHALALLRRRHVSDKLQELIDAVLNAIARINIADQIIARGLLRAIGYQLFSVSDAIRIEQVDVVATQASAVEIATFMKDIGVDRSGFGGAGLPYGGDLDKVQSVLANVLANVSTQNSSSRAQLEEAHDQAQLNAVSSLRIAGAQLHSTAFFIRAAEGLERRSIHERDLVRALKALRAALQSESKRHQSRISRLYAAITAAFSTDILDSILDAILGHDKD